MFFFLMNKFLHVYFTLEKIPIWFEETDKSVKLILFLKILLGIPVPIVQVYTHAS